MLILIRRAVWAQAVLALIVAILAMLSAGGAAGLAAFYGGVAAMINTALLYWRWHQGAKVFHCDAGRHLRTFYRSSLERLFVVGACLAIGFRVLELPPKPLLTGFVIGLMAWILASAALRERN